MIEPAAPRPPKPKVGWYWWPLWIFLLAVGLFFFYVVMTPVWIAIRLVAYISERTGGSSAG